MKLTVSEEEISMILELDQELQIIINTSSPKATLERIGCTLCNQGTEGLPYGRVAYLVDL